MLSAFEQPENETCIAQAADLTSQQQLQATSNRRSQAFVLTTDACGGVTVIRRIN
jgi:hypothetical protein